MIKYNLSDDTWENEKFEAIQEVNGSFFGNNHFNLEDKISFLLNVLNPI